MALDHGTVRTGVAVCDPTGTLARPLAVVERVASEHGLDELLALIAEERPGLLVVGLPVSLDAREHAQAQEVRRFADVLSQRTEIPVVTYDERFSTAIAKQRGGTGPVDARAAALILEDSLRTPHGPGR
jgi:putative Holliday junction resolvase